MPNRLIKDSIHDSEKVNAMTDFQFRLWISLITYVDDYGRGDARAAIIKGNCFPLRERLTTKDIESALAGLAVIGSIVLYEADGKPYLCFPNWERHQTIRNKRSKFPAPPDNITTLASNCKQVNANVSVIQSNPIQSESISESKEKVPRFAPPTQEEAKEYFASQSMTFNLDAWFSYYEQNGWMVGNRKMKDWKASMRYWQSKEKPGKKPMTETAKGFDNDGAAKKAVDQLRKVAASLGVEVE